MSTQAISLPPPLPTFDSAVFRLKLAGLTDPDSSGEDNPSAAEHKATSIDLCVFLCELFGETLDRLSLWDRIASALATAASKTDDGDTDRFITLCLEHVKADPAAAARHLPLGGLLSACDGKSLAWRQGWVRYISGHSYAIVSHARATWEQVKESRKGGAA